MVPFTMKRLPYGDSRAGGQHKSTSRPGNGSRHALGNTLQLGGDFLDQLLAAGVEKEVFGQLPICLAGAKLGEPLDRGADARQPTAKFAEAARSLEEG